MSKFASKFKAGNKFSGGGGFDKEAMKAMQDYLIKEVDCEVGETLQGYAVGIAETGTQPEDDFTEYLNSEGDKDYEDQSKNLAEALEAHVAAYNEANSEDQIDEAEVFDKGIIGAFQFLSEKGIDITTGAHALVEGFYDSKQEKYLQDQEVYHNPNKDADSFALVVDFPDYMVDKGQFFGDKKAGDKKPLRLVYGGTEWSKADKKMYIGKLMRYKNKPQGAAKEWGYAKTNPIHKMAAAAGLLSDNGLFSRDRVLELIGENMSFTVTINRSNTGYYNEKITAPAKVAKGMPDCRLIPGTEDLREGFEDSLFYISFNPEKDGGSPNDDTALTEMRSELRNTIMRAQEYKGSELEADLIRLGLDKSGGDSAPAKADNVPASKPQVKPEVQPEPESQDEDEEGIF